jgi:hypothetical protein
MEIVDVIQTSLYNVRDQVEPFDVFCKSDFDFDSLVGVFFLVKILKFTLQPPP